MKVSYLPRKLEMNDSSSRVIMLESHVEELQTINNQLELENEKLHKIIHELFARLKEVEKLID